MYLPYPPSINNYWIASGHRRFISQRGKDFKAAVSEYVIEHDIPKLGGIQVIVDIILRPHQQCSQNHGCRQDCADHGGGKDGLVNF